MYDDPYYCPYRYSGGTRAVFARPLRPEPRFIFKDRQGASLFITRVPQRPLGDGRRRDVREGGRELGRRAGAVPFADPRPRAITRGDGPARERPRAQPRRPAEGRPQRRPPAPPRVQPPAAPPPPPRNEPRAEPKRDAPKQRPQTEPELKRRKP